MARVGVRVLVSMIVGIVGVLLSAGVAAACSCALATVEEQAEHADVIARVVVTMVERPNEARSTADPVTYTARATAVWKGEPAPEYTFVSALDGASCGLEGIEEGQEIILFASAAGDGMPQPAAGQYRSTLCSGTGPATEERVAEITDLLGEATVPAGAESVPDVPGTERGWIFPAVIAVVAGLGVIAVYVRRHRRSRVQDD